MSPTRAGQFADRWIDAWNRHDVEAVLVDYADDVVFRSPRAALVVPESGGVVVGKPALRSYWTRALQAIPPLDFRLDGVFVGVDTVVLLYRNGPAGPRITEVMQFTAGRISSATVAHEE
jgi:ketosteroid isomerase-like protein